MWEMQDALMMTGRSSPCALCNGKGAPGDQAGLGGNREHGFSCPMSLSGQSPEAASQVSECSPVPSCPPLLPWLCPRLLLTW